MTKNDIKKALYKEKPQAYFQYIRKGIAYYKTKCSLGEVLFEIPVDDMGDADFRDKEDAQLLNRWLMFHEEVNPKEVSEL